MVLKKICMIGMLFGILGCFAVINASAAKLNEGPNGVLSVDVRQTAERADLVFRAGDKVYHCNYLGEQTYTCSDGTSGYYRHFFPFQQGLGELPKHYMDRIRVGIIFYEENRRITYLTDGTVIVSPYLNSANGQKTAPFTMYSALDPNVSVVTGVAELLDNDFCSPWDTTYQGEEALSSVCPAHRHNQLLLVHAPVYPKIQYTLDNGQPIEGLHYFTIQSLSGEIQAERHTIHVRLGTPRGQLKAYTKGLDCLLQRQRDQIHGDRLVSFDLEERDLGITEEESFEFPVAETMHTMEEEQQEQETGIPVSCSFIMGNREKREDSEIAG